MANELEQYINTTIAGGDANSKKLAQITAPTLRNGEENIKILRSGMNGLTAFNFPQTHNVIVHSIGADSSIDSAKNSELYGKSLIERLYSSRYPSSIPQGLANVIDASESNNEKIALLAEGMVSEANKHQLKIVNGELAILGSRVNGFANCTGTLISIIPKGTLPIGIHNHNEINYAVFDHEGKPVFINSDGIGTKTQFYEQSQNYSQGIYDFLAMNLDDTVKIAANAKVISGGLEFSGNIPLQIIMHKLRSVAGKMGVLGILQPEDLTDRLGAYAVGMPTYNISGSVVSIIDEERINNLPRPQEGDSLIAIRSQTPNPRSNGISARRKLMETLGQEWIKGTNHNYWHETEQGKEYLKYLASPSTVFYPTFTELLNSGLASSVYHMSGGAFNGKLARPLAKEGLFVSMTNIFPMSIIEEKLFNVSNSTLDAAYGVWPMGNEGFITTTRVNDSISVLRKYGLEAIEVGKLVRKSEITGVEIHTPYNKIVQFSGRD